MNARIDTGTTRTPAHRRSGVVCVFGLLVALAAAGPASAQDGRPAAVALALFAFELEDASAAGALAKADAAHDAATMQAVTDEARRLLESSGRYRLVDAGTAAAMEASVWRCDGCDAHIARSLGADQSLAGMVRRVAQTEYYVAFRLVDAASGRVVDQQAAFFIGSDEAWKSGVRSLLRRSLLADRHRH